MSDGSPPPLPQRNIPRKSLPTSPMSNSQVSDLDASMMTASGGMPASSNIGGAKRKSKTNRVKANSDPKMSSDLMLQMESSQYPPPLPPRTNFHEDGVFGQFVTNKDSNDTHGDGRSLPNSLATQMNFPVISTSVTVRDGIPPPNYNFNHRHQNSSDSNCNVTDGVVKVEFSLFFSEIQMIFMIYIFCYNFRNSRKNRGTVPTTLKGHRQVRHHLPIPMPVTPLSRASNSVESCHSNATMTRKT